MEVHAEYVLSQLLQKEQFSIARKYANIVNSTASKVTVKKVSDRMVYTHNYCVVVVEALIFTFCVFNRVLLVHPV